MSHVHKFEYNVSRSILTEKPSILKRIFFPGYPCVNSTLMCIIRFIPKKDEDLLRLKNWRPIPLLNLDYKIAAKALALRLEKVFPSIINDAKTGYMEGRFIGENVRLISDILHVTAQQYLEGIALFIDFEKAFESLEWDFPLKTLYTFQFGHAFKPM